MNLPPIRTEEDLRRVMVEFKLSEFQFRTLLVLASVAPAGLDKDELRKQVEESYKIPLLEFMKQCKPNEAA